MDNLKYNRKMGAIVLVVVILASLWIGPHMSLGRLGADVEKAYLAAGADSVSPRDNVAEITALGESVLQLATKEKYTAAALVNGKEAEAVARIEENAAALKDELKGLGKDVDDLWKAGAEMSQMVDTATALYSEIVAGNFGSEQTRTELIFTMARMDEKLLALSKCKDYNKTAGKYNKALDGMLPGIFMRNAAEAPAF